MVLPWLKPWKKLCCRLATMDMKAVLTSTFTKVAKQATAAVKCLNASSSKWLVLAREQMVACYGTQLALFTLCETRWNSMQNCFASLLRVRTALDMMASNYRTSPGFPSALNVFNDGTFWSALEKADHVIAPLSEASYRVQHDENTLSDEVISFRDIYVGFNGSRAGLIKCVEDLWEQCEQPLLLLTYVLNPLTVEVARVLVDKTDENKRSAEMEAQLALRGDNAVEVEQRLQNSRVPAKIASSTQLGKFAVYYYRHLIGDNFGSIRGDLAKWIANELTSCNVREIDNDVVRIWQNSAKEHPLSLLPSLAIRLLSVAVNTATT
ncbi:hypothetical protein PHMEG_00025207 [Phytophthora megakarya]|uniref:Uncharacterized protein n=1 Tax=Phytophthora megakarya TaxID=4795 RepID=A0A225VF51_9STRA|nr:hypothetical protein PHMEG_00025207 [Phytophthora megakarya]